MGSITKGLLNLMQASQSAAQFGRLYAGLVLVMLPTLILYMCVQQKNHPNHSLAIARAVDVGSLLKVVGQSGKVARQQVDGEGQGGGGVAYRLITLAVVIIVPVAWVFLASIKQNSEFYGNPWVLPATFYWQNFVDAWNAASMGSYMINSVIVTALALAINVLVPE